jgi:hypothetical protein
MNPPGNSKSHKLSARAITHKGFGLVKGQKPVTKTVDDILDVIGDMPRNELHAKFGDSAAQAIYEAYKNRDVAALAKLCKTAQATKQDAAQSSGL